MTDEAETQAVGTGARLTRSPLFGIGLTLLGALIITPDTLLIRLSGLEGWPLTAWRGLLIGGSMLLGWMIMAGRQMGADLRQMATMPFLVIMLANGGNTLCQFCRRGNLDHRRTDSAGDSTRAGGAAELCDLAQSENAAHWAGNRDDDAGLLIVVYSGEGAMAAP